MLKRTLCFENPGHISVKDNQLVFTERTYTGPESNESAKTNRYKRRIENLVSRKTVPLSDIGVVLLENQQLTISIYALDALAQNNVAVITCDKQLKPSAMLLPLEGHSLSQKNTAAQLDAPRKQYEQLWKQTVIAKIRNQAECLARHGKDGSERLLQLSKFVTGGDPENREGKASLIYFKAWGITRQTSDNCEQPDMPNCALNYGYAIIRSAMARALAASGLLCIRGIHHHGQYNAFALADDIMEPYRPFADSMVFGEFSTSNSEKTSLSHEDKTKLLKLLASDVVIDGFRRPMAVAMTMTSASLAACFLGRKKHVSFPEFA